MLTPANTMIVNTGLLTLTLLTLVKVNIANTNVNIASTNVDFANMLIIISLDLTRFFKPFIQNHNNDFKKRDIWHLSTSSADV